MCFIGLFFVDKYEITLYTVYIKYIQYIKLGEKNEDINIKLIR